MIVLDTSSLSAILFGEDDAPAFLGIIHAANHVIIGAPTLFEFKLVASKRRTPGVQTLVDGLIALTRAQIIPFTADHVTTAVDALHRFGGRPARLNYGDCMAYAVAKVAGCPLLYKGGDFALTDVAPAR